MATEETLPPAAGTVTHTAKANHAGDKKATNPRKTKEKNPSKPRARSAHPSYLEMIGEAITSLKEKTGSSQYAITKFIEDKYKAHLPSNFSKLLLIQLRKFAASGKLTKVKNSYKLPATTKKPIITVPAKAKKAVTAKPKPKLAGDAKPKVKAVVKPKPKVKAVVKPKPKAGLTAKPKKKVTPASKPKAAVKVSKPKPKTVAVKPNSRPAKAAKTSAKDAPGKKVAVAKKTLGATKKVSTAAKTANKTKSAKSAVKLPGKKN